MAFLFSACWTVNEQTYKLLADDKDKTYLSPHFNLNFDIYPTRQIIWKIISPYHFSIFGREYRKHYKKVVFENITLLFNDSNINLLTQVEAITIFQDKNGQDRLYTSLELQQFSQDKVILFINNENPQAFNIRFTDLNIKYNKVKTFQVKIQMKLVDIEDNIIEVSQIFTFEQAMRKISAMPTV